MLDYTYNLIYDHKKLSPSFWAFLVGLLLADQISITKVQDLEAGYAGLAEKDLKNALILVIDFAVDEDFEALDESYVQSVSDKRIYRGKQAIEKCFALLNLERTD